LISDRKNASENLHTHILPGGFVGSIKRLINNLNLSAMQNATEKPVLIDKEVVSDLRFPEPDVLFNPAAILKRKNEIERAVYLGNTEHTKVRIMFQDADGLKQIETTIWGSTDKRIILKSGMVIPIHRIQEIKI
jgi:uncharacterized protein (UPF0248 family)